MRGAPLLLLALACAHLLPGPKVVAIHARRFSYTPSTVTLKR